MLALPICSSDVRDFTQPLLAFLRKHRRSSPETEVRADEEQDDLVDIKSFESLREVAVLSDTNEGDKRLAYHHVLAGLIPRLSGYEKEMQLQFCWSDPFIKSQGKQISQSLYFDWAHVLWNHGACLSLQAALLDLATDESIREACKSYQQASGTFDFIRSKLLSKLDLQTLKMTALSDGGLAMASSLMLAQAQLCFYKKAVKDHRNGSMKPLIVAKLAKQTATFYTATSGFCRPEQLKGDASWFAHCEFEAKCFDAAAEYWQALAVQEASRSTGVGEAIARLMAAEEMLQQALALCHQYKLSPSIGSTADELLRTVSTLKAASIKDNDMIYFNQVPSVGELTAIVPVAMVKPMPLPETDASSQPILFGAVLPASMQRTLALIRERADALAQTSSRDAAQATDAAREMLASVGLPSSLEVYKSGDNGSGIPDSLWEKVLQIQQLGGVETLLLRYPELQTASQHAFSSIERVEGLLQSAEQEEDGEGSEAIQLSRTHKDKLRDAFFDAQASDASWASLLSNQESLESLRLLSSPREALIIAPPPKVEQPLLDLISDDDNQASDRSLQPQVIALEELLVQLVGLIDVRTGAAAAIAKFASSDWPAALMSRQEEPGTTPEDTVAALLQPAELHTAAIRSTISQQQTLLPTIMSANTAFVHIRATDAVTLLKDALVQKIERAIAQFGSVQANLSQALNFYTSLQQRLDALSQELEDGALARRLNKEERDQQRSLQTLQEQQDLAIAQRLEEEHRTQVLQQQQQQQLQQQQQQAYPAPPQALQQQQQQQQQQQPPSYQQAMSINGTEVTYGTPVQNFPGTLTLPPSISSGYPSPSPQSSQPPMASQAYAPPPYQYQQPQQQPHLQTSQQFSSYPGSSPGTYQPLQPQYQHPYQPQPQQYQPQPQQQQQLYQPSQPQQYHPPQPLPHQQPGILMPPVPTTSQRLQQMGFTDSERAALDAKVRQLQDMGFTNREQVVDALLVSGMSEEAAINRLLGSTPTIAPTPPPVHPSPNPNPAPAAAKPGAGLFGALWGRK